MKTEFSAAHTPVADLNVSGELIQIGITDDSDGSIFIRLNNEGDAIYMSVPEARLVITAFAAAIQRIKDEVG